MHQSGVSLRTFLVVLAGLATLALSTAFAPSTPCAGFLPLKSIPAVSARMPSFPASRSPLRLQTAHRSGKRLRGEAPLQFSMSSLMDLRDSYVNGGKEKVPISLLSGFLGSGKTTLLREVLENKGGHKVGVVVNDMAAINIDSKLVKSDAITGKSAGLDGELIDTSEVMELQNGCACCSASDELAESLLELLAVAAKKGEMFDRIVIETSGVSEPKAIRRQFFDLMIGGHPIFDFCDLQNMVTVVDCGNFLSLYESESELYEKPELIEGDENLINAATRQVVDLLTDQVSTDLLGFGGLRMSDEETGIADIRVPSTPDVTAEGLRLGEEGGEGKGLTGAGGQVETADYVLLNKKDKVAADELVRLTSIVGALNPGAEVIPSEYGKVDLKVVLGSERETWTAHGDDEDDFRVSVAAAREQAAATCADPACTDPSHAHSHADDAHAHSHADECADPACTDSSHSHSHSHSHAGGSAAAADTPEAKFGISSFVYSRRRPFDTERLKRCILELPISGSSDAEGTQWRVPADKGDVPASSPMRAVIRSKGFVWLQNSHRKPLYWSHAGQYFDLKDFGMFWAATPLDWWPRDEPSLRQIVSDFGGGEAGWGDRRQEIVFIGVGMDQKAICERMDECLLSEAEMAAYEAMAEQQPDAVKIDFEQSPPKPVDLRVLRQ